mgnify:CR=1 FL=1
MRASVTWIEPFRMSSKRSERVSTADVSGIWTVPRPHWLDERGNLGGSHTRDDHLACEGGVWLRAGVEVCDFRPTHWYEHYDAKNSRAWRLSPRATRS